MAISKLGGTGSDNWELISSVTPTAASAAVNFTGLSVYRKLMLVVDGVTKGGDATNELRLNNDSNSNYMAMGGASSAGVFNAYTDLFTTSWRISQSNTARMDSVVVIENCDTTNIKTMNGGGGTGSASRYAYLGVYRANAVISQVNFITSSTFNAVGTVALYGVK
jgi:hypothetical protein